MKSTEKVLTPKGYEKIIKKYAKWFEEAKHSLTDGKKSLMIKKFDDRVILFVSDPQYLVDAVSKWKTDLVETVTTGVALASHAASDGVSKAVSHGTAFGKPFFDVDSEVFSKARLGRAKHQHWAKFMGKNDQVDHIKKFAKENGNPDILLRHPEGMFMFAQKGMKKNG